VAGKERARDLGGRTSDSSKRPDAADYE
jgi:hypothetical protein